MASPLLPHDAQQLHEAVAASFAAAGLRPRAHQVDAVCALVKAVRSDCSAQSATSYLLQHAAGSGKSLTIAALAAALLRTEDEQGARFHTVLLVNDRLQLDDQLAAAVTAFLACQSSAADGGASLRVARAASSEQLRELLSAPPGSPGRPAVVLTTIQKLASLARSQAGAGGVARRGASAGASSAAAASLDVPDATLTLAAASAGASSAAAAASLAHQGGGRVAVIADEAHRHHDSSSFEQLSTVLAAAFGGSSSSPAAAAAPSVVALQQPRWVTFIGFTATPGARALQLFGAARHVLADALGNVVDAAPQGQQQQLEQAVLYAPAHVYSLQQAIADGCVLDVLQRFVAVSATFSIDSVQLTPQQRQQLLSLDQGSGGSGRTAGVAAAAGAARRTAAAAGAAAGAPAAADGSLAAELLVQAASSSRQVVSAKAEEVAARFVAAWAEAAAAGLTGFRAMLVVRSRQHVVWYCAELRRALLQRRHADRVQQLLAASGTALDLQAASAVAAGDATALCFGAFSGSVPDFKIHSCTQHSSDATAAAAAVAAAEAAQLRACAAEAAAGTAAGGSSRKRPMASAGAAEDAAAAATGGTAAAGAGASGRRQRRRTTSGWDAALAAFDERQLMQQEQQSRQGSIGGSGGVDSSSSSDGSENESEAESVSSMPCDSESDSGSGMDSAAGECGAGAGGASSCAAAAELPPPQRQRQQQQQQQLSSAAGRARGTPAPPHERKRPRRNASTLSSKTAACNAAAQPAAAPASCGAAAAADGGGHDAEVVLLTERDINTPGLSHADARLLVVCNKFETGYDDPRLAALFVDRPLSGARAVQVLGRVNRPAPHKGGSASAAEAAVGAADDQGVAAGGCADHAAGQDVAAGAAGEASAGGRQAGAAAQLAAGACSPDRPADGPADRPADRPAGSFPVLVVDFANTVGTIREAFSEFYGPTTHITGDRAKRRRQQQALDDAVSRLLEVLQTAAARAHTTATLVQRLQQQQQQQQQGRQPGAGGGTARCSSSGGSGGSDGAAGACLGALNVQQLVQLVMQLAPEASRQVEDDLSSYCSLCVKLRREALELPYVFASATLAQLTARRQRRDQAAASGRLRRLQQQLDMAGPPRSISADGGTCTARQQQQQQQQHEQHECGSQADVQQVVAAVPSQLRQQLQLSLRGVCQLQETFAGPVRLAAADSPSCAPLPCVKLSSHLAPAAAAASSSKGQQAAAAAAGAGRSAAGAVQAGRPLSEIIAAANAQLAGRSQGQAADGLQELCRRLRAAQHAGQPAGEAVGCSSSGDGSTGSGSDDVYAMLSLLRRLQLWPVTAEVLRATGAGKQVAALQQSHQHEQVRQLAAHVVATWKTAVSQQAAAAAAAAAAKKQQAHTAAASSRSSAQAAPGISPAACGAAPPGPPPVDAGLRSRVAAMLHDALLDHQKAVAAAAAAEQAEQADRLTPPAPAVSQQQAQQVSQQLEAQLHAHVVQQAASGSGSNAGQQQAAALQEYKRRARMLCTGLRYPDGVAAGLLVGERRAAEVVALDALALAPAAVQRAVQQRREQAAREEAVWEQLVATSVGGGGTFISTEAACGQCGERRAQVHSILSGGTYAQERTQIQKFVCLGCSHTWRSD